MGTVEHYPCCAESGTERHTGIDGARADPTASRRSLRDHHRYGALIGRLNGKSVMLVMSVMPARRKSPAAFMKGRSTGQARKGQCAARLIASDIFMLISVVAAPLNGRQRWNA
jgi:hypothetical protein